MSKFLLHLIVIEFFFFSGEAFYTSTVFKVFAGGSFFLTFTCVIYVLLELNEFRPKKREFIKILVITLWFLLSTYVLGIGNHDLTFVTELSFGFAMFLVASTVDFFKFRNLLLHYLVLLSVISIIVQIGHDYLGIFPAKLYIDGHGAKRLLSLGLFTTEWGENRLASWFWEPGQYQIVLCYTFVLFADEWSDLKILMQNWFKFGVIILALLMTNSTTAYLMLMLIVIVVFLRQKINFVSIVPLLMGLGIILFYIYSSDSIQDKLEQRENEDVYTSSYSIRMADNIGCWNVTLESPIYGYGPGSDQLSRRLLSVGSISSSNGWLYATAQLGIPLVLFFWLCIWKNLKGYIHKANCIILFCILLLSQANESYIFYPYVYMYVFSFSNLNLGVQQNNIAPLIKTNFYESQCRNNMF